MRLQCVRLYLICFLCLTRLEHYILTCMTRVTFTGKVGRGKKVGEVMSHDPRPPPISTPTTADMSMKAKRQDKETVPPRVYRSHRPSDRYRVKSGVLAVLNVKWLKPQIEKNAYFRRSSRNETPFLFTRKR